MAFVYQIGLDLTEQAPYKTSYIGVTRKLLRRWQEHSRNEYKVGHFIRANLLNYDQHMKPIYEGTDDQCYALEQALRPLPNMGLNTISGGSKGAFMVESIGNPFAGEWEIRHKKGALHFVDDLHHFCRERDLVLSTLWKFHGQWVPYPRRTKYAPHKYRLNTTDWKISDIHHDDPRP